MRALLTSHGSTGDIYPVIALGKAMKAAGHEVRFATVDFFKDEVERAGLDFVSVPPDWDKERLSEAMRHLSRKKNPIRLLQAIYHQSIPFIGELMNRLEEAMEDCDLVVSSYLFAHFRVLAEKKNKPFAVITFSHNVVPSPNYPPFPIAKLWLMPRFAQTLWNRLLWRASDRFILMALNRTMGKHMKKAGRPKIRHFLMNPGDISLVAVSGKLLNASPNLTNSKFQFTGYLRWQSKEDPELGAELDEFCAGEKVPILNFGSVSFDNTEQIMARFMNNWPAGKKLIMQTGWANLSSQNRPEIMVIGKVSHDQLFRYGSVIIHHGGAGTTASALHAGVPQIIVPHFGDQYMWGREVRRLGAGIRIRRRRWPERLISGVQFIESHPHFQKKATEIAEILATEDGEGNAVAALEELYAKWYPSVA